MPTNIAAEILRLAAERPDDIAVVQVAPLQSGQTPVGREWTRARLAKESLAVAHALRALGLGEGRRLAVMVPPSPELYALTFGAMLAGTVPVFIDPGMGLRAIKGCLAQAAPDAFIGSAKAHLARLLFGWQRGKGMRLFSCGTKLRFPGVTSWSELLQSARDTSVPLAAQSSDAPAAILFTSGSTGAPKGALYQQQTFAAQTAALREYFAVQSGDIDCATFPLFGLMSAALGAQVIIPPINFTRPGWVNPEHLVRVLNHYKCTMMFGSPALLKRLASGYSGQELVLPHLRRVISAGAPVAPRVMAAMQQLLGEDVPIFTPYGATEALPVAIISSQELFRGHNAAAAAGHGICVGAAVSGLQLRIIKISDKPVATWSEQLCLGSGAVGEIVVKGPQVSPSYFAQPHGDSLAKIVDPAGGFWHRMGDLGYLDSDQRLWFCGRKSHRVPQTFGPELYTIPCEGIFLSHPAVSRAALVGFQRGQQHESVVVIEPRLWLPRSQRARIVEELWELVATKARGWRPVAILLHREFPVDRRHNAKIFRERLALWAARSIR